MIRSGLLFCGFHRIFRRSKTLSEYQVVYIQKHTKEYQKHYYHKTVFQSFIHIITLIIINTSNTFAKRVFGAL